MLLCSLCPSVYSVSLKTYFGHGVLRENTELTDQYLFLNIINGY